MKIILIAEDGSAIPVEIEPKIGAHIPCPVRHGNALCGQSLGCSEHDDEPVEVTHITDGKVRVTCRRCGNWIEYARLVEQHN